MIGRLGKTLGDTNNEYIVILDHNKAIYIIFVYIWEWEPFLYSYNIFIFFKMKI